MKWTSPSAFQRGRKTRNDCVCFAGSRLLSAAAVRLSTVFDPGTNFKNTKRCIILQTWNICGLRLPADIRYSLTVNSATMTLRCISPTFLLVCQFKYYFLLRTRVALCLMCVEQFSVSVRIRQKFKRQHFC